MLLKNQIQKRLTRSSTRLKLIFNPLNHFMSIDWKMRSYFFNKSPHLELPDYVKPEYVVQVSDNFAIHMTGGFILNVSTLCLKYNNMEIWANNIWCIVYYNGIRFTYMDGNIERWFSDSPGGKH